jgi:hypothetical protein
LGTAAEAEYLLHQTATALANGSITVPQTIYSATSVWKGSPGCSKRALWTLLGPALPVLPLLMLWLHEHCACAARTCHAPATCCKAGQVRINCILHSTL